MLPSLYIPDECVRLRVHAMKWNKEKTGERRKKTAYFE